MLGAAQFYGVAPLVWSFISPHGYLELTCIVIAGAAGLMLGDALLRPGLLLRREALGRASRRAVELAVGAAPVLVVAGLIEGFISPSDLAIPIKLAFGPLPDRPLRAPLQRRPPEQPLKSRTKRARGGGSCGPPTRNFV